MWARSSDWSNAKSSHIISNNFRGGWSIGNSNGFYNPTYTVFDKTYGHLLMTNVKNKTYTDFILPPSVIVPETAPYATPAAIVVDSNLFTWVLDDEFKKLYKIDSTGDIIKQYVFLSGSTLHDMAIDKNNMVWVMQSSGVSSQLMEFNQNVELINSVSANTGTVIDVDISNNVIYGVYDALTIDNNNEQWYISGGSVYKSGVSIISNNAKDMVCDRNNNIWVINNNTDFIKISSDGTPVLSGSLLLANNISGERSIGIMDEYISGTHQDVILMVQSEDSMIYRYDSDGEYMDKKNLANNIDSSKYIQHDKTQMVFTTKGDFTGYDWNRKFRYIPQGKQSTINGQIYLGNDIASLCCISLSHPTSGLINGDWTLLTMTHNPSGVSELYVDGVLRDTVTSVSGLPVYHQYENAIIVGGNAGRSIDLDTDFNDFSRFSRFSSFLSSILFIPPIPDAFTFS